ncbi:MAG: COX15/CtaA family protein [Planctomycetota bacterium]|nr:COX15/CtaA family protein [Planctomycetota bacterium]MDA1211827.1 COX15/CtaA family protein [Planctomycetota bacterium]
MYRPWVFRLAWMTTMAALLPIAVGALVTTLGAGMAFPDWPTSHGHNMLTYPWLQSVGDEFIEHGHRLAGMLVGLFTLALTALVFTLESRRWVKVLATVVLLGVITQGVLGGIRVLAADKFWAMIHGTFAACIFSTMAVLTLVTSKGWFNASGHISGKSFHNERLVRLTPFVMSLPLVLLVQFMLGGLVRHQGRALHEHLGMGIIAVILVVTAVILVSRLKIRWLSRPALGLLGFVVVQVLLGVGAWITKFGFASLGYVAVHESQSQVLFRSAHTVVGMLLLMTSIVLAVRFRRLQSIVDQLKVDLRDSSTNKHETMTPWMITGGLR